MKGVKCIAVLRALGELNRMRIMHLLLNEELGSTTVASRLSISQYNASKHLRILKEAGLLQMQKSGKERRYSLATGFREHLEANRNVLELGCCSFRFDQLPK